MCISHCNITIIHHITFYHTYSSTNNTCSCENRFRCGYLVSVPTQRLSCFPLNVTHSGKLPVQRRNLYPKISIHNRLKIGISLLHRWKERKSLLFADFSGTLLYRWRHGLSRGIYLKWLLHPISKNQCSKTDAGTFKLFCRNHCRSFSLFQSKPLF